MPREDPIGAGDQGDKRIMATDVGHQPRRARLD
jgi:hypothetical protein